MEQRQGLEWTMSCQRSLRLKWGCIKGMCCQLFFAVMVDVVNELSKGVLCQLLYVDDLVFVSETIEGLENNNNITNGRVFERKCLKINLDKTK